MVRESITVEGMEARLFQIGIRCDYYVSAAGECFSLSKGRESRIRRLTPCTNGHRFPTIRVKVFEGELVVVRNLPIYRIVYDTFSEGYHDWGRCRISYIDGNVNNCSFSNMTVEPLKKHNIILVEELIKNVDIYSSHFSVICDYVTHRFERISLDASKDIVSDAFYMLCRADAHKVKNFLGCWVRSSFFLADKYYRRIKKQDNIEFITAFHDEPSHDFCNLSIYRDLGLSPCEKVMIDLMMKGYSRMEVGQMMGCKYDGQIPVKFYNIALKFRRAYCD